MATRRWSARPIMVLEGTLTSDNEHCLEAVGQ